MYVKIVKKNPKIYEWIRISYLYTIMQTCSNKEKNFIETSTSHINNINTYFKLFFIIFLSRFTIRFNTYEGYYINDTYIVSYLFNTLFLS